MKPQNIPNRRKLVGSLWFHIKMFGIKDLLQNSNFYFDLLCHKKFCVILPLAVMMACVSPRSELHKKLDLNLQQKDFIAAAELVNSDDFYAEKNSILVNKLEKATLNYLNGNYYQSLRYFDEAQKIGNELYTVSLKSKMAGLWDGNADDYYGQRYEISLIRFYKSLLNYNLYKRGVYEEYKNDNVTTPERKLTDEERLKHLRNARSNIMEWESLTKSYQQESAGKPEYKVDLLSKIWGAFIFEENGGVSDVQRALALYKSAKDVLLKNYNIYPTFNKKHREFKKNFNKLHEMDLQYIKNNFVAETDFASELYAFIDIKIDKLAKGQNDNLVVNFKENFIPKKGVNTVKIPIHASLLVNQSSEFISFLQMMYILDVSDTMHVNVEFPYVRERSINNRIVAKIFDEHNIKITEFPVVLIEPLSDIGFADFEDKKSILYSKIMANVAAKYSVSLTTIYEMYKSNNSKNNVLLVAAALSSFKVADRIIKNSTHADLRQWTTLPGNIRIGSCRLDAGNYTLKLYSVDGNGKSKIIHSENINISDGVSFVDVIV